MRQSRTTVGVLSPWEAEIVKLNPHPDHSSTRMATMTTKINMKMVATPVAMLLEILFVDLAVIRTGSCENVGSAQHGIVVNVAFGVRPVHQDMRNIMCVGIVTKSVFI